MTEVIKKYWDNRPCNIMHSRKPIGTREYFDEVEQKKYFVEPHIPFFAEFEKWKGKKVLEIGCGIGTDTIQFLRAGANITAIDISSVSVSLVRKRIAIYGLDKNKDKNNVRILEGSVENLTDLLGDEVFDLVYCFGVLHHVYDLEKAVKEISCYVKPNGGEFRFMVYSFVSYKAFHFMHHSNQWNMGKLPETVEYYAEAQLGCPLARVMNFDDVNQLLYPYFHVQKIWKDHIFKWDINEYIKGNYVVDSAWRDVPDDMFKKFEKELGFHTMVIATLQ